MRRAVLLLLGGCAQSLGLTSPVLVDASADTSGPIDSQSACAPRLVGATLFGSDVSMTAVPTPEGYAVLAVERAGGSVRLQRFSKTLEPIDPAPISLGLSGSLVAATTDSDHLVAGIFDQDKTRMYLIPLAPGQPITTGVTLPDPIAEGDAIVRTSNGSLDVYTAHTSGYFHYTVSGDLLTSSAGPGGGTGGAVSGCVVSFQNADGALVCPKTSPTEALCFTAHTSATGTSLGNFASPCPDATVVQDMGFAYAAYDTGTSLSVVRWASLGSPGAVMPLTTIPNASNALIDADADGIVIAMRRQGDVYTTRTSTATPYVPMRLEGMPPAFGFAIARGTQGTVLFVAAATGIYRACI